MSINTAAGVRVGVKVRDRTRAALVDRAVEPGRERTTRRRIKRVHTEINAFADAAVIDVAHTVIREHLSSGRRPHRRDYLKINPNNPGTCFALARSDCVP